VLRPVERLPDGRVRVDAHLTRCGIFEYRNPDGSTRREYRPEKEVFNTRSMRSFALVPFTDDHPPDLLTADDAASFARGSTGCTVVRDDDHIRTEIGVFDRATIQKMDAGKLHVSCGYTCDLEEKPGFHPVWGHYDAIQRNIIGNHVALVDMGRAGSAAVRMDAAYTRLDGEWDESLHPRAEDGKFGSGSGGANAAQAKHAAYMKEIAAKAAGTKSGKSKAAKTKVAPKTTAKSAAPQVAPEAPAKPSSAKSAASTPAAKPLEHDEYNKLANSFRRTVNYANGRAFTDYSGMSDRHINRMLRETKGRGGAADLERVSKGQLFPDQFNDIATMSAAIRESPLPRDTTVHRVVQDTPDELFRRLKPGDSFTDHGFVSTTADKAVLDKFYKGPPKQRVNIQISLKAGSTAAPMNEFSVYKGERELLLDKGQKFKVKAVSTENGVHTLYMERQ
jgi:hypothetical protein